MIGDPPVDLMAYLDVRLEKGAAAKVAQWSQVDSAQSKTAYSLKLWRRYNADAGNRKVNRINARRIA